MNTAIDYDRQHRRENARPMDASHLHSGRADNNPTGKSQGSAASAGRNNVSSMNDYRNRRSGNEEEKKSRLNESRERHANTKKADSAEAASAAKNIAQAATPTGALALIKEINMLADMPYFFAIGAAILKDITDIADFETVVLPFIFSILCSIFIFFMMVIAGSSGKKRKTNKFLKKSLGDDKFFQKAFALIGGGIADSIPVVDFIPFETLSAIYIYFLVLADRKNA